MIRANLPDALARLGKRGPKRRPRKRITHPGAGEHCFDERCIGRKALAATFAAVLAGGVTPTVALLPILSASPVPGPDLSAATRKEQARSADRVHEGH